VDLAGVAAATGYYDQAHLCREFVRFAGAPPRAWLAEEFQNIQDRPSPDWHPPSEPDPLHAHASPEAQ
jgi:AraC-like DNA-binding protein